MNPIILEFDCPDHGRFEAMVERTAANDVHPCPDCQVPAPWTISAPGLSIPFSSAAVHGGYTKPEHPMAMDTRELGEGMPIEEWRKKRAKKWADHDRNDPRRRELAREADKVANKAEGFVRDRPDQKKRKLARLFDWARRRGPS